MDSNVEIRCKLCDKLLGYSDREQEQYCGDHTLEEINPPSWSDIRLNRNEKLAACDWTQLADANLTADEKTAWATYRQTLRDIPQTYTDPAEVVWPVTP